MLSKVSAAREKMYMNDYITGQTYARFKEQSSKKRKRHTS